MIELRPLAHNLADMMLTGFADGGLEDALAKLGDKAAAAEQYRESKVSRALMHSARLKPGYLPSRM